MNSRWILGSLLVSIAACRAAPQHRTPEVALPDAWSAEASAAASADPPEMWWQGFGDRKLDSLIERAVAANLDLSLARSRVLEARALRDIAAGERRPELDARASYTREQASANTRQGAFTGSDPRDLYDVGFDATWEVDLFGSLRHGVEAAEAGLAAAEEGRRDVLVTLLAEVAREYVELRGLQRQVALTQANAQAQRQTLELTRARFEAGLATELDIARAQTLLANTEAAIPSLEAQASGGIHRLSVLLGEAPGSLAPDLASADQDPEPALRAGETLTELSTGLPADLLRRRPDIRRAERELARAAALTAQATSDLYPKLTLGASTGLQSISSGDLLESDSRTWSIGPSILAPIFDGGRLRAAVRVQDARQEQAVAEYQKTVLTALAEVESELVAVARERERSRILAVGLDSSRRALDLANDLHLRGLVDFFEVLDAQRSQLVTEAELVRSQTALSSRTVALYKALGGGWETWEAKPEEEGALPP